MGEPEVDTFQNESVTGVTEADIPKFDISLRPLYSSGIRSVRHIVLAIEDLETAPRPPPRPPAQAV